MAVRPDIVVHCEGDFITPEDLAALRSIPGISLSFFPSQGELEKCIMDAEVVAARRLSSSALIGARRLKWFQIWSAGVDHSLYQEMVDSPVIMTSCKGNGAIPMAEHAIMLMLMLNRNAVLWFEAQQQHKWFRSRHGELNGLTCGIIGLGNSGVDLAEKAHAFHMRVLGMRRTDQPAPFVDEIFTGREMATFLAQLDFLVVSAPLTSETLNMIADEQLRVMKPSACVICYSRGGIVNEEALLGALQEGRIAGAGLDVFETEPLPPNSPFWSAPNTIVTPHDGSSTNATFRRSVEIFRDNLTRYAAGKPLRNVIDKKAGY